VLLCRAAVQDKDSSVSLWQLVSKPLAAHTESSLPLSHPPNILQDEDSSVSFLQLVSKPRGAATVAMEVAALAAMSPLWAASACCCFHAKALCSTGCPHKHLQDEDSSVSFLQLVSKPRGAATVAMEVAALAAMSPFRTISACCRLHVELSATFACIRKHVQDEDSSVSLWQLVSKPRGAATVAMEVAALAAMSPFLAIELGSMLMYAGGWLNLWNVIDVITYR
jgi:hypothetical protein